MTEYKQRKRVMAALLAVTMAAEPVVSCLPGSMPAYAEEVFAEDAMQPEGTPENPAASGQEAEESTSDAQGTQSAASSVPAQSAASSAPAQSTASSAPAQSAASSAPAQSTASSAPAQSTTSPAVSANTANSDSEKNGSADGIASDSADGQDHAAGGDREADASDTGAQEITDTDTGAQEITDAETGVQDTTDAETGAADTQDITGAETETSAADTDLSALSLEELEQLARENVQTSGSGIDALTQASGLTDGSDPASGPADASDPSPDATAAAALMASAALETAALQPVSLAASSDTSIPMLQQQINQAMAALETLSGRLTVILTKNTTFEGDITINAGDRAVADDFELELTAEDAGDDGISGDGTTIINANVVIQGIRVVMNSIMLGAGNWITVKNAGDSTTVSAQKSRGGDLEYNASKNAVNNVSVKVGSKSTAELNGAASNDTFNVEMLNGADSVAIDAGDGLNVVNAVVRGGDFSLRTGSGNDTVTVDIEEGAGGVSVDTGASYDNVTVINNGQAPAGREFVINTGDGDDMLTLDMRAGGGSLRVNTGGGGDTLNVLKGDHYTIEDLDYAISYTTTEVVNSNSTAILTIENGDADAVDRATVDAAVADAIKGITFTGGKGVSVHLKGYLKADADEPITRKDNADGTTTITLTSQSEEGNRLDITSDLSKTNYTDALKNKQTIEITDNDLISNGTELVYTKAVQDFTDYVLKTPAGKLNRISISGARRPLLLSNIVIDTEQTMDDDDHLQLKQLDAQNLNVLLKGETIDIEGAVNAQNVRAEAVRGSHVRSELIQRAKAGDIEGALDMFSLEDAVEINFKSGARVTAAHDIAAVARVKHTGGLITILPASVNLVNIKLADAHINVESGAQLNAGETVDLLAKIQTTTGYDLQYNTDGSVKTQNKSGMPVATTFIFDDAGVKIAEGARIVAGEDIRLSSESTIKTLTYADTGMLDGKSLPFSAAIALTVISNDVHTSVAGNLAAGRKVSLNADGSISDDTDASKTTKGAEGVTGIFVAANVVDQDVASTIEGTAKVTAERGDVYVGSSAVANIKTSAIASASKQKAGGSGVGTAAAGAAKNGFSALASVTLVPIWEAIKGQLGKTDWYKEKQNKDRMEELDKLMNSVSKDNYTAKVIEPDPKQAQKGSATVKTETVKNENNEELNRVKATVTVTPVQGCTVNMVQYRYLKTGEDGDDYSWGAAEKNEDGTYSFYMPSANVEVVVTYNGEPADGGNGQNDRQQAGGNNHEDNGDGDTDLGNLFDQVDDMAENDPEDNEDIYSFDADAFEGKKAWELSYKKDMTSGHVVTWLTDAEGKKLTKIYEGQKVLFVGNPDAGMEMTKLTISYTVTLDSTGEKVTKTDTIAPDDQGRYIYTVPEDLKAEGKLEVNAVFEKKKETTNEVNHYQVTGAVAVGVLLNDNSALIEQGAEVIAQKGSVDLYGFKTSVNETRSDGTAVTKDYGTSTEQPKATTYTTVTKYTVTGAQYAIAINSTIPDAIEGTVDREEGASRYFPIYKVKDAYAGRITKAYITYYTMINTSLSRGKRVTVEMEQQTDSEGHVYYQPSLTNYPVVEGTVLQVNFVFDDEAAASASGGSTTSYLVRNPIAISVNAISEKQDNGQSETTSIGEVSYVKTVATAGGSNRYYFNVAPKEAQGYTLANRGHGSNYAKDYKSDTSVLYATWRDTAGRTQKAALTFDPDENYWYFDPADGNAGVPAGNLVTIVASFSEDLRDIALKSGTGANGTVSFSQDQAKAGDEVTITATAKDGYYPTKATLTYLVSSAQGIGQTTRTVEVELGADGTGKFTMPHFKEGATLYVEPDFSEKNVLLTIAAASKDKIVLSESGTGAAAGQKITVTASDAQKKEGYRVTEVTLVYNGSQHAFSNTNEITIPSGTTRVEVQAKLEQGKVAITPCTQELGTISAEYGRIDPGETVTVTVKPAKDGYRAKSGTVKAQITTKSGVEQVVLTHVGENKYTFTMPSGAAYEKGGVSVVLQGEFEEGSDGVALSAGVSIAVGVTKSDNDVQIRGGNIVAGTGVSLTGFSGGGKASTEAKAGYSKGKTGLAGGIAVQVVSDNTNAVVKKDENGGLTIGSESAKGSLSLTATGKHQFAVTGDATGKKGASAEGTGVGAGIAVAVSSIRTVAEIEDGVNLGRTSALNSVSVSASEKSKDVITAKSGAKGGTAIVPVAAVDVVSTTAKAKLGSLNSYGYTPSTGSKGASLQRYGSLDLLDVAGKVTIKAAAGSAKAAYNHLVTADASGTAKGSALGGAFIVTWIDTSSEAILNQSLRAAKDIKISSSADDSVKAVATAAVTGGKQSAPKNSGGSADRQANSLANGAANIAGSNGMDGSRIRSAASNRQKSENSDNTVSAAGAFVLNMQSNSSLAEIQDGVNVTTPGKLSVTSANRTDATIKADASATQSNTGVGVGIAINIVNVDNIARIGTGAVSAGELELTATIAKAPTTAKVRKVAENQSAFRVQLTALLEDKIAELFGTDKDSYYAKVLAKLAAPAADELIRDLHLEKLFGTSADNLEDLFANPVKLLGERIEKFPETLIAPFVTIVEEFGDLKYLDGDKLGQILLDEISVQAAGQAITEVKQLFTDNKTMLLSSGLSIVSDGLGGSGWSGSKLTEQLKGVAMKGLKDFGWKMLQDAITKGGDQLTFLTDNNFELARRAYNRLTDDEGGYFEDVVEYVVNTFRDEVYDYEALMVEIGEKGFRDYLKEKAAEALKASGVAVVNETIDALVGQLDVKIEKEAVQDRHIITTQAIAGAGAAEKSGAGSLAIAVANLNTKAQIASSGNALEVEGQVTIDAEELRRIRTHATAAVDEDGEADNKTGEGSAEHVTVGGSNASQDTIEKDTCSVTTVGGASAFDDAQGSKKVWITPDTGFTAEGATVTRSYQVPGRSGTSTDTLTVKKSADGKYYVEPYDVIANTSCQVDLTVECAEVLHKISEPKATDYNDKKVEGASVSVRVPGRDSAAQARVGDVVEVTTNRPAGKEVFAVVVTYKENGQEKKLDLTTVGGVVAGSSNKDEETWVFTMPDGDVTDITVLYENKAGDDDEAPQNGAKDSAGRSVGVGAAFSLTYGASEVKAEIGERSRGVSAGTLSVTAVSEHDEENYATAGTEPFSGTDEEAEKAVSIDASVSVNILDNDIRAGIDKGTGVRVTGAGTADSDTTAGSLTVTAEETSSSETKASSFATGSTSIVGAAVAVNLSKSDVRAELGSGADAAADVTVRADAVSADETWAFATALGGDVQRVLNKVANGTKKTEEVANNLTTGAYFDKLGQSSGNKSDNKTSNRINSRLNQQKGENGQNAVNNVNLSSNVLRSQGVEQANGNEADNAVDKAKNKVKEDGGKDVDTQTNTNEKKKMQIAAAVGVTVTNHNAAVTVGDTIRSGGGVETGASNTADFYTRSTGAAMSLEKRNGGYAIAAAVGVSVDNNKATVDVTGGIEAKGDVSVTSALEQNISEEMRKHMAVQAVSGTLSGQGTTGSVAGAVSVLVSNATTRAQVNGRAGSSSFNLEGAKVTVSADDKSKLGLRAGGINATTGTSVGSGLSAAVLVSNNVVKAQVGDGARVKASEFTLQAIKRPVTWDDAVSPYGWSDLVTDTSALNDEQRQNVYTGIFDVHKTPGSESYTVDVNLDSHNIMKAFDALNMLAYRNYYVEAIAGSLAVKKGSKTNGTGSVAVTVANNTVDAVLGSNVTVDVAGDESADGKVDILADGSSTARVIAGAVSGGKAKNSVGISVSYYGNDDEIHATIGDNVKIRGDALSIGTKADAEVEAYNAAASVATGADTSFALGGAVNVITLSNEAKTAIGSNAALTAAKGGLAVSSTADMDLVMVSAALTGSGKGVAAGGTAAVIVSGTQSEVEIGKNHKLTAQGDLDIAGKTKERLVSVAASASGAFDAAKKTSVAGSINVLVSESKGNVTLKGTDRAKGSGSEAEQPAGLVSKSGSVSVQGKVDTSSVNVTAALDGSKGTAIGLSVNGNWFERESKVNIEGGAGYGISAGKDVYVTAYGEDTTVLAGLAAAGSTGGSAISGNLQLTRSANTVSSTIGAAGIYAGGEAGFASRVNDHTYAIAGSLALSNQETAVGATAVVLLKDNTITTDLGKSVITANGNAGNIREALKKRIRIDLGRDDASFSGVYAGATQKDVTVTVGAGVAIAKEAGVSANLAFVKNESTIKADTMHAVLSAGTGSIRQEAAADTIEWVAAGGLGIAKFTGAGASASGIYAVKTVEATAGTLKAGQNVTVAADNTDNIHTLGLSAGGGEYIAVQIGIAAQVLGSTVQANALGNMVAGNGSVTVRAKNDTDLLGVAASAAVARNAAFSPVGAVMLFNGKTQSIVTGTVTAAKDINIKATADKTIDQYTVGLAVPFGGLGISGAVNLIKTEDSVLAAAEEHSVLFAENNINIEASGDYKAKAMSAAVTLGAQPTGAVNAMIHLLKSKVEAELAGNAGQAKAGTTPAVQAGNVNVTAHAARDVIDGAAAVTFNPSFLAVGATVMVLQAGEEKLSQDAADTLVYGGSKGGSNEKKVFDIDTYLSKAEEQGIDVSVLSGFRKDLEGDDAKYSDIKLDSVKDTIDVATEDKITLPTRKATTPSDMVIARITDSSVITTKGNVTVRAVQPTKADLYGGEISISFGAAIGATVAVASLHSNVLASAMGTINASGGKVSVDASSYAADVKVNSDASESARMAAFTSQLGEASGDLRKTLDPTRRSIRVVGIAANGGVAGVGAAVGVLNTDNLTNAVLGGRVNEAGEVSVHGDSIYDNVVSAVLAANIGIKGLSVGASVGYAGSEGETVARIDSGAQILNTKTAQKVSVTTDAKMNVSVAAASAAGGGYGGINAGVAYVDNQLKQTTYIGPGAVIRSNSKDATKVDVTATSDSRADTWLLGVSISAYGAAQAAVSMAHLRPTIQTGIGNAEGSKTTLRLTGADVTVANKVTSTGSAGTVSINGALGVGLNGALLRSVNHTNQAAQIANIDLTANTVKVSSALDALGEANSVNINVGAFSGALANTKVDLEANNLAMIDTTGGTINAAKGITIDTGNANTSKSRAAADSFTLEVGIASLGMNYAKTVNNTTNMAQLTGTGAVKTTGGTVDVSAYSDASSEANIKPWSVTGVDVKVDDMASGYAENTATSLAEVTFGGALNSDLKVRSDLKARTDTSAKGGGLKLIEVLNSNADAKSEVQSLVKVDIAKAGTRTVGIDVQNHVEDKVNTDMTRYTLISPVGVSVLDTFADCKGTYATDVRLGSGDFDLNKLNVTTDYTSSAVTKTDAGGLYFSVSAYEHNDTDAKATNESYAGTTLTLDDSYVMTGGADVNVKTTGSAEAVAKSGRPKVEVNAISTGSTDAIAELTATQAAALVMNDGTLKAGNLNVTSEFSKAKADAQTGSLSLNKNEYEYRLSLLPVTPFEAKATEKLSSTAMIQGSGGSRSRITAKDVKVRSGASGSEKTGALSEAKGSADISLMSIGNLNSNSTAAEKIYTVVDGVRLTASGKADIEAASNTDSTSRILVPVFSLSLVSDFRDMESNANIGKDADRQVVKTVIGDSTVITAGDALKIGASNQGSAETQLEKGGISLVASVLDYEERTKEYFDTGVQIGRNTALTSEKSTVDITSTTGQTANSGLHMWNFSIAVDTTDALGHNVIRDNNELSIGDDSIVEAAQGLNVKTDTKTTAQAESNYFSLDLGASINKVYAENDIQRNAEVTIGRGTILKSDHAGINVESVSGNGDKITADARIRDTGIFVDAPESHSTTKLSSTNIVRVGERASLEAEKDINLIAAATSKNGSDNGVYNQSVAKGGSAFPVPNSYSDVELNMDSMVYLNRGLSTGNTSVTSKSGNVNLKASNDGMRVTLDSNADNDGFIGDVDAYVKLKADLYNQVWVDNASLSAKKIDFLASNDAKLSVNSYAELYAATGGATAHGEVDGDWNNFVSTYDKAKVTTKGTFTHTAASPSSSVSLSLDPTTSGWATVVKKKKKEEPYKDKIAYHCDFCSDPSASDDEKSQKSVGSDEVRSVERYNGKVRDLAPYENAADRVVSSINSARAALGTVNGKFAKALASLADVRKLLRTANKGTGVTKARYGEEDTRTAAKIFELGLEVLLQKDVRLTFGHTDKYRMWTNSATQLVISLLPNASRLSMGAGNRLHYVADTVEGDVFGDGQIHKIDIITALTEYAFAHPVIAIGSGGSLDFTDGMLEVPAGSDLDLYLYEISSAWLLEQLEEGTVRVLSADQEAINACAREEKALPDGEVVEALTRVGTVLRRTRRMEDGSYEEEPWQLYWAGYTPQTAPEDDTPLYSLLVNEATDEVDALRTSRAMMAAGQAPVDVSLYLYRDENADRMGEVAYDMMFFDTDREQESVVKAISSTVGKRETEVPHPLQIVLRIFLLDGADLPAYSISGHLFAMNDGTDGIVRMFDGFYVATFADDVFESDYLRVDGTQSGAPVYTIKAGQSIWPEWTSQRTAEDIAGLQYVLTDEGWTLQEEEIEQEAA